MDCVRRVATEKNKKKHLGGGRVFFGGVFSALFSRQTREMRSRVGKKMDKNWERGWEGMLKISATKGCLL